jgi:putative flippase GtrA
MNLIEKFLNQELLIYLFVGGATFVIYIATIALTVEIFNSDYRIGVSVAYLFAITFHFFANRKFTFRATNYNLVDQSIRYVVILILNYLITLIVVSFCVGSFGFSPYLGAVFAIVLTVGVGYFASKFWVFRESESLSD